LALARTTTRRPEDEEMIEDVADDEEEEEVASSKAKNVTRKDRPTPSRREEGDKDGNIISRSVRGIVTYFKETKSELQQVTWLSREDAMRLTRIVVIVLIISASFLGLVGFLFGLLTQAIATEGSTVWAGAITLVLVIVVSGAWLLRDRLFPNFLD
jgi:preprotein translocase subunit SecE